MTRLWSSFGFSVRCVADGPVADCDSIVKDTSATICAVDLPYVWGDTVFQVGTETGIYRFRHSRTATGCDSTVILHLYVVPVSFTSYPEHICEGDTVVFGGRLLYESGIYSDTLTAVTGCDSIVHLDLTVLPVSRVSFSDAVCSGSGYRENGFGVPAVFADTLVSDTLQTGWGCDSIRNLYLTVHPVYETIFYDTVCAGEPYYKHGFGLPEGTPGGSYRLFLLSQAGCDSVLSLHLTVLPAAGQVLYDSICPSEHYVKYGFDLFGVTAGGSFQLPLQTVRGCDSLVTLDLYVYPSYFDTRPASICEGDTIGFRGRQLYEGGIYYDSLTTVKGCDSIYCMLLTVRPVYDMRFSGILCEGRSYTEHGFDVVGAGIHYRYLTTVFGCDSILTLDLVEEKKIEGTIGLLPEDCSTHGYTFFFESGIPLSSYRWDMGDGTVLRSEKGVHTYADSGVYRIQLRTKTFNGCEDTFSYVQRVPHYLPYVPIYADRQIISKEYPTVRFRTEVFPEMACLWDFGDGKIGKGDRVSHTYDVTTEKYYEVTLKVIHADGCITENKVQIEVAFSPEPVNTFSPNGDGINDIFMIGYRVEILNRNGLQIYSGNNGWDGMYKGNQAPEDTYFYRLYFRTSKGEKIKTGYITLIR